MFKVVRENVLAVNEDRKSQQRNIDYKNLKEFLEPKSTVIKIVHWMSLKEWLQKSQWPRTEIKRNNPTEEKRKIKKNLQDGIKSSSICIKGERGMRLKNNWQKKKTQRKMGFLYI